MSLLLLSLPLAAQQRAAAARPDRRPVSAASAPLMIVFDGRVILCNQVWGGPTGDCTGGRPFGTLHNEGLALLLSPENKPRVERTRDPRNPRPNAVLINPLVDILIDWLLGSMLLRPSDPRGDELKKAINEKFLAAGVIGRDGRFIPDVFNNPQPVVAYLGRSGTVTPAFTEALNRLVEAKAPHRQYEDAFQPAKWQGKDRMAAALLLDIKASSMKYWETAGGGAGPAGLSQNDLWDALGALLLIETGPGAVLGGLAMSAACCGFTK